jgi:hypothetical protein
VQISKPINSKSGCFRVFLLEKKTDVRMRTKSSNWFAAMLRKSLRSIFPLRVFGSAGAQ